MKYCEACGQQLEDDMLFCTTCGERQPQSVPINTEVSTQMEQPMQNIPAEMSLNQGGYAQETPSESKKSKKKIIIPIIAILALAIMGVAVYFIFFGSGEKKAEQGKGIMVNGEFYEFTPEEGIKDYNDIQGGVVKMISEDNWSNFSFKPDSGGDAIMIDQKSTVTWVYSNFYEVSDEDEIAYVQFYFRDGYSIDGLDGSSTREEILDAGYIYYIEDSKSVYTYATEDGNVDWDVYREDYEKVEKEGSFKCLPYYETLATLSGLGAEEFQADDWEGYCDIFHKMKWDQEVFTMYIFCRADLEHKYKNGDIEMFMSKSFTLVPEGSEADHLFRMAMFANKEDIDKWYDSWKEYE